MILRAFHRFRSYSFRVPWCVPSWGWAEWRATVSCVLRGRVVRGPAIERFEEACRERVGTRYTLAVNRGRTAIELALHGLGITTEDEVILPSYVCSSVLEAVQRVGATPCFADVDEHLQLTVSSISAVLGESTRCVIVPHLYGRIAPIDQIETLLAARGIPLIDDAAQALGMQCGGRPVGTFGQCGILSVGPGKSLAGTGCGVLITDDDTVYRRATTVSLEWESSTTVLRRVMAFWIWRRFRRITLPFKMVLGRFLDLSEGRPGDCSARLSNLEASIAEIQLRCLPATAARRRQHCERLVEGLGAPGVILDTWTNGSQPLKVVLVLPEDGPTVASLVAKYAARGVECQAGYRPCHDLAGADADVPRTDGVWRRVLCLPIDTPIPSGLPLAD